MCPSFLSKGIDHPANLLCNVLSTVFTTSLNLSRISNPINRGTSTGTTSTFRIIMFSSGTGTVMASIPLDFCLSMPNLNTVREDWILNLHPTYLLYALLAYHRSPFFVHRYLDMRLAILPWVIFQCRISHLVNSRSTLPRLPNM